MGYADPEKQRRYQREWAAARRAEFLGGKICERCGASSNLEAHHRDAETKTSHRIWAWSRERIENELAKCEIVCRSCHLEISHLRRRLKAMTNNPHGTENRYGIGCRCPDCCKAKSDSVRRYKKTR